MSIKRLMCWNVNSLRARLERIQGLLQRHQPYALALQETKVENSLFPYTALQNAGYQCAVHGQKTYNGVAILTRETRQVSSITGLGSSYSDDAARALGTEFDDFWLWSLYVPNGSEPESDKFRYKLAWLDALLALARDLREAPKPSILAGDFNIAPGDADVCDANTWRDTVLCRPEVRERFAALQAMGFSDTFRSLYPDTVAYSWWDYRHLGFPKNQGLRIDHMLIDPRLQPRLQGAGIDRDERKGKGPSDHAPIWIDLSD